MNRNEIQAELTRFFANEVGTDTQVTHFQKSNGHSGLTFLFDLKHNGQDQGYVLRLPPPGVRRSGNTDVYRQVPLLRTLYDHDLPVPTVPWACAEETWFGLPFMIMDRLPGRNFLVWDPDAAFARTPEVVAPLWQQTAQALAKFHRFDAQTHLADWQSPRSLATEIDFWQPIYEHAAQPEWVELGAGVQKLLHDSMPTEVPTGLVHGDFQPGNAMFNAQHKLTGIIDWELSHIGAQTLDIGWMMMAADPQMWHGDYCAVCPPPVTDILAAYEQALGRRVPDASWYQALGGYILASIACLNVKLHRKGQREDPLWESIALSIPTLFGHAEKILLAEWT